MASGDDDERGSASAELRLGATAWLSEETEDFDETPRPFAPHGSFSPFATGLFSANVDTDDAPDGVGQGLEGVTIGEGLAWARARAAKVFVRSYDEDGSVLYSAGELPAGADDFLPWPDGGLELRRRRIPGWEHLDRTAADPVIQWDVAVTGGVSSTPIDLIKAVLVGLTDCAPEALLQARFEPPEVAASPPPGTTFWASADLGINVVLRVSGRTVDEACAAAVDLCKRALEQALPTLSPKSTPHAAEWGARAYPVGSWAAAHSARTGNPGHGY